MKLIEALELLKRPPVSGSRDLTVSLVCGFNPLHLETFLAAELRLLFPDRAIAILTGLYGDFPGNLQRVERVDVGAIVLEWSDLDPRLGIRRLGGWGLRDLNDILKNVKAQTTRVRELIERVSATVPLAICPPTLPLPPLSITPGWQASTFEQDVREFLSTLEAAIARFPGAMIINQQRLARLSPLDGRFDVRSELQAGFPYTLFHAAIVAELLARLIREPVPKKGLITDLDDTLWRGILGEVGIDGISWDLEHHTQIYGLYQQLLDALAEQGVLIGIASKNDPDLVEEAFRKAHPILSPKHIYPVEVHWGPKSKSVARILATWNVAADSVVFVDDSPMELAEVRAAHPEIECVLFPRNDDRAAYVLLEQLRDLFGKGSVSQEDAIRLDSIRATHSLAKDAQVMADSPDQFLEQVAGKLAFTFATDPPDPRALELVNKTNQFNLNGKRYTEADWRAHLRSPDVFMLMAAYEDKYGPLGKIAVVSGHASGKTLSVEVWVMSCRAFSRRIEHQCLKELFERLGADEIVFDFSATPRNGPLQSFFAQFVGGPPPRGLRLARKLFFEKCPPLFLEIKGSTNG